MKYWLWLILVQDCQDCSTTITLSPYLKIDIGKAPEPQQDDSTFSYLKNTRGVPQVVLGNAKL